MLSPASAADLAVSISFPTIAYSEQKNNMSLLPPSRYRGYVPQYSNRTSEMDNLMSLSREKLQLESARGEPNLRKLLAHVCTVEHVQEWLLAHPPGRKAPPPLLQDFVPSEREVAGSLSSPGVLGGGARPILDRTTTGHLRSTVTAVREVDPEDHDSDSDSSSDGEESWDGSDTSDDTVLDLFACEPTYGQSDCLASVTVCRDFAYDGGKDAEMWPPTLKLLSTGEYRELAKLLLE